ncbi:MAG TPA: ABC transporter ATP-binding protein [Tepidisphaeraceae bacterium]|jgi:ATP-binding cassette subfamily B protein/subfamily B ATP-binding cassette protein MsbA
MNRAWYWRLMRHAPRHAGGLAATAGLLLIGVGLEVLRPWPLKVIVDDVLKGRPVPAGLRWVERLPGGALAGLAGATVVLFVTAQIVAILVMRLRSDVGGRMSSDLAADVLDRVQRIPPGRQRGGATGDLVKRVTVDTLAVKELILSVMLPLVMSLVTLGIMFGVMWGLDRGLAVLALLAALPMVVLMKAFARPMAQRSYEQQELEGEMLALAEQTLTAIPVVQAFAREEFEDRRFRALSARTVAAYLRAVASQLQFKVATGLVLALGTAAVMGIGGMKALRGPALSVGDLLVFLSYLASLYAPLETLAYLSQGFATASAGGRRVLEVLDRAEALPELDETGQFAASRSAGSGVTWENVTFGYDAGTAVLHEINLDIAAGKMLAVVGPTGAGKSTLVSLVPRLSDPWSGRVLIDGVDAKEMRLADARGRVAMVLQEPFLLPLSVAENIAYGWPGASRAEIERAAVAANADGFIRALPQGYDTVIGERGASLSGGERQRLAIARAILKDAPILILDEPTASLDAATEEGVMEALGRLMAGRTVIVIAHRLSTVRKADAVAVIDGGRLVQYGTHEELVAREGLYRRLTQLQGLTA